MSFAHIWVLLFVPIVLWVLLRRRQRTSLTVASIKLWPEQEAGKARWLWLPVFLRRLAIVLVLVALARPQAGTTYEAEVSEGIAIQLLVDVSSSMDMSVTGLDGKKNQPYGSGQGDGAAVYRGRWRDP